jgi:hypothetical protein
MKEKNKKALSGIALGLLVGIIIGLSVSQVVGIILAALTSLLATFFGLNAEEKKEEEKTQKKVSSDPITITFFSASCFLSILLGIYLRTHDTLSPGFIEEKKNLIELGVKEEQAISIILKNRYGIIIEDSSRIVATSPDPNRRNTSLYRSLALLDSSLSPQSSISSILQKCRENGVDLENHYNLIKMYIKDTTEQKDILISTLNAFTNK